MADKAVKGNMIASASAACFMARALAYLFPAIHFFRVNEGLIIAAAILDTLGYMGLAAAVFLRNRKAVTIAAGVQFLAQLLILAVNFSLEYFDWIHVFTMLTYASLAAAAFYSARQAGWAKKICFLPAVFFFASLLAYVGQFGQSFLTTLAQLEADDWVCLIAETAALILAGFWLRRETEE